MNNAVALTVGAVLLGVGGVVLGMALPDGDRPNRNGGIGPQNQTTSTR
ncbi:MAG: hypothetical protein ACT4QG_11205 [Sporichthyaceae bacterium]